MEYARSLEVFEGIYDEEQLSKLLSPDEFEQLVHLVFDYKWDEAIHVGGPNDKGIDVVAKHEGLVPINAAIQVKQKKEDDITPEDIRKYDSLPRKHDRVDVVVIATSRGFTSAAREEAEKGGVKLISGRMLIEELYSILD